MLKLAALKETRATKTDALRKILAAAETEHRDLTDAEQSAFDAGRTEVENVERDIRNAEFLAELERREEGTPVINTDWKFASECRKFSLLKAIASQVPNMNVDCGRELEISAELERRNGRAAQGIMVPNNIFEKRIVTTALPAAGPGSNIIATELLAGQYIDILRAAMCTQRLGARVLNGLVGNVDIPKLEASATAYWVAENAAITHSDMQFDKVSMTPKHVGVITEFSRNMLLQSSPDVESIARSDFAAVLARGVDSAAILGGGADEPTGVLLTSGVTDVPGGVDGLVLTYANIIKLIAAVAGDNALEGSLGFATNSDVVAQAATTLKDAADTASSFIIPNPGAGSLAGYPMAMSNLVPKTLVKGASGAVCSALIFGNWADLLIGYWSSFDLLVNPYETTAYSKGNVLVRGMLTCDVQVRQAKSFAKIADILA